MKPKLVLIGIFLLIVTIGAPPVVENVPKDKKHDDSKADSSDEVASDC
jgi:hypothetical protein